MILQLVERTLEALSDSGQIVKKTYGKQKVFCADQVIFAIMKITF